MIRNNRLYSDKAANIKDRIDNITINCIDKKAEKISLKISLFWSKDKYESIDNLLRDYPDENSRNYIQKYAETEINDYNSKVGKFSYVFASFVLIISAITSLKVPTSPSVPVYSQYLYYILLIILPLFLLWLFIIPLQKNLLKTIIMKIEDEKLNKQKEEIKSTSVTQVPDKDMKINVEKFNLNLSISGER